MEIFKQGLRLVDSYLKLSESKDSKKTSLKRKTHLTIKKVTEDMEGEFHFNTALSAIMELTNEIYTFMNENKLVLTKDLEEAIKAVIILLVPFVPHIAEEMWERLGNKKSVFESDWPLYDEKALVQDEITLPVQINGKVRSRIAVPLAASEDEIKKIILKDPVVNKWIDGKNIKKFIVIKGKIINLVV